MKILCNRRAFLRKLIRNLGKYLENKFLFFNWTKLWKLLLKFLKNFYGMFGKNIICEIFKQNSLKCFERVKIVKKFEENFEDI